MEGLLARHLATQCKRETQAILDEQAPVWQPKRATRSSPTLLHLQQSRREERLAHYEQVIALRKLGLSQAAIARQVGIGASTVQSWLAAGAFPERKPREQGSRLDRYLPYLFERWEDGSPLQFMPTRIGADHIFLVRQPAPLLQYGRGSLQDGSQPSFHPKLDRS